MHNPYTTEIEEHEAGRAATTQEIYLQAVRSLAKHYNRWPELINIEIPAHFPSGSARTRTRGGASRIKNAIGKITGGVRCFAARAKVLLDTHEARSQRRSPGSCPGRVKTG